MSTKKIFCVSIKDLFCLVQTFRFEKMFSALKTCLIVVHDYTNLFSANLNIHVFYNKEKEACTLPAFFNHTNLTLSTPEPNDCLCDKFIPTIVKNEVAYSVVAAVEKTKYNYGLAYDRVVLMVDEKFSLIRYQFDTCRFPFLKPDLINVMDI